MISSLCIYFLYLKKGCVFKQPSSPPYLGSGHRGPSLGREAQASLSSSTGTPTCSQASWEISPAWPRGLLPFERGRLQALLFYEFLLNDQRCSSCLKSKSLATLKRKLAVTASNRELIILVTTHSLCPQVRVGTPGKNGFSNTNRNNLTILQKSCPSLPKTLSHTHQDLGSPKWR